MKVEPEEFQKFIKEVKSKKKLALEVKKNVIRLATGDKKIYSFLLADKTFQKDLKNILSDEKIEKYGNNLKQQLILLGDAKFHLKGIKFDIQIAGYLLNLQIENISLENIFIEKERLEKRLNEENSLSLFQQIELPLIEVLADMEQTGITVKPELLIKISKELKGKIQELKREIYEIAGEDFNIASPKQLGIILFEKLGLTPVKRKKTGFSTDAEVLGILSKTHILPQKILEYRELFKLKSTYVDVLPGLIDPENGRLHTSYNQTVTSTGRLSSSNPNLQNIPVRSSWGRRLREAFSAPSVDCFLLGADYSQVELRLLAHFSRDELLCKSFENNEDIHAQTAQEIFGLESRRVNVDLRRMAKTINFGIIYGMSAHGLSRSLKIEVNQAQDFIDRYFAKYQGVKKYIKKSIEEAKDKGYVTTMFGRRRYIPQVASFNRQEKEFAERVAVNTPIQGSAAEIIKLAMLGIWQRLEREKLSTRMILQVHDELILEVPEKEVEEVKEIVKTEMEGVGNGPDHSLLSIPLKVNLTLGRSWAEL